MIDLALWISLGVFLLIIGLSRTTNITIQWSEPLSGFAAIIAGILCLVKVFHS